MADGWYSMAYAEVGGLRMYYEEHGRADGPPLVLLHGFFGTGAVWERQIGAFGDRYRLLVPDLRGHGRTDNPGGLAAMNHRQFARDVVGLCRARGIERAAFCGHSTGAMLLLTLGLEAPALAGALVLAGGTYFYGPDLRAWWAGQTPESLVPDPTEARATHTALGPEHWRTVAEAFIVLGRHAHTDDFPEESALPGLAAPALIVHGDRDHFFPVQVPTDLYGYLPDAELCILPRTDHGPPAERPEWFNAIVRDFLARRYDGEDQGEPAR
ncbi:MAG TPA: alpha/beta hydrolase [Thermomicrobiales bacterium]|nr:alpha/beta hydrolase [Thermomicrobiales bacterium]